MTIGSPVGTPLTDGVGTTISFSLDSGVHFYEQTLQPPGVDEGPEINLTNLRNTVWRTSAGPVLKQLTDGALKVQYEPECYLEIIAMVGKNQTISIQFNNGLTLAQQGRIASFKPDTVEEGKQPTAAIVLKWSNTNSSGVETGPTLTPSTTTTTTTTTAGP